MSDTWLIVYIRHRFFFVIFLFIYGWYFPIDIFLSKPNNSLCSCHTHTYTVRRYAPHRHTPLYVCTAIRRITDSSGRQTTSAGSIRPRVVVHFSVHVDFRTLKGSSTRSTDNPIDFNCRNQTDEEACRLGCARVG